MENNFVVAWKCILNARIGKGKNLMELEEARQLAAALNAEHPGYLHVAIHQDEADLPGVFKQAEQPAPEITSIVELIQAPAAPAAEATLAAAPASSAGEEAVPTEEENTSIAL